MALATLANCQKIINQLLNRNRTAWATIGGTGANKIGAYPFDEEIDAALLRADGLVITEGYFRSKSAGLRQPFWTSSGNVTSGASMPFFSGLIGKAEFSVDAGVTWQPSIKQDNDEDIAGLSAYGANVRPSNSITLSSGMHRFGRDGHVYHGSPLFRFYYPIYTRTGTLQALEQHESIIINWAIELLNKQHAEVAVDWYRGVRQELLAMLIEGDMYAMPQQSNYLNGGGQQQ